MCGGVYAIDAIRSNGIAFPAFPLNYGIHTWARVVFRTRSDYTPNRMCWWEVGRRDEVSAGEVESLGLSCYVSLLSRHEVFEAALSLRSRK